MKSSITKLEMPQSLWAATAIDGPQCPQLEGDITAEVVVIGAGFTGSSAALHLAENNRDVVVVDAGPPGVGASGRNGGQVVPAMKRTLEQVQQVWGTEKGAALYKVIASAPDLVFDLIHRHDIDCHPVRTGIIQPAYSKTSLDYLRSFGRYHAGVGAPVEFLDRQQTSELLGSDYYLGGFIDKRGGSVQPLSYCRGLALAALAAGASFFSDSPVVKIDDSGSQKRVLTSNGSVTADRVLICTNGYTDLVPDDPLINKLSRSVIPFYSYKVATKPLPVDIQAQVLPGEQVVADSRRLLTYFRKDHTGRLVMGSAGGPYEGNVDADYGLIVSRIRELYPQAGKVEIEYRWCGKVCLTQDHVPHIHELAPGIFTGLGFNGRGVAMGTMMGKWLAAMAMGTETDTATIPVTNPGSIPFHKFRKPFIKGIQYLKDMQDRIERY
jgi:glycine/D-amino acid oxidase-like deaminating enzyme